MSKPVAIVNLVTSVYLIALSIIYLLLTSFGLAAILKQDSFVISTYDWLNIALVLIFAIVILYGGIMLALKKINGWFMAMVLLALMIIEQSIRFAKFGLNYRSTDLREIIFLLLPSLLLIFIELSKGGDSKWLKNSKTKK